MADIEIKLPQDRAYLVRRALIREANRIQSNVNTCDGMDASDPSRPTEDQLRSMRNAISWLLYQARKFDEYVTDAEKAKYSSGEHVKPKIQAKLPDGTTLEFPASWDKEKKRHIPDYNPEWNFSKPLGAAHWLAHKRKGK